MKKACVMLQSRKQAGRTRLNDADLRQRIIHDYTEIDSEGGSATVQNEVSRLLEKSESLLEEPAHGGS